MKRKIINTPDTSDEIELNSIVENKKDVVILRGKKWKVGWIRNRALRKITDIQLNEKEDSKISSKCAAALLLNG